MRATLTERRRMPTLNLALKEVLNPLKTGAAWCCDQRQCHALKEGNYFRFPNPFFHFGNSIQKQLPSPTSELSPALPPIRSTPLRTSARPIPVPGYSSTP